MPRGSDYLDTRSYLSSGESVESYVKRMLPTIEDRVEACRKAANVGDGPVFGRPIEAYAPELTLGNRLWWAITRVAPILALALVVSIVLLNIPNISFGWNTNTGMVVGSVIAVSLSVALAVGSWQYRSDQDLWRNIQRQHRELVKEREADRRELEYTISIIRNGWVPNYVGGLAWLGLSETNPHDSDDNTYSARWSYKEYLRSPHWKQTREDALRRAGYRCQLDASHTQRLQVHHNSYARLGSERPEDLIVLCDDCHRRFHAGGRMPGRT